MVKFNSGQMDHTFFALSDATRRAVLQQLLHEPGLSISAIARQLDMKLPRLMKHLDVLSDAGLIERTKTGRTVFVELKVDPMKDVMDWLGRYERLWTVSLDRLVDLLEEDEK